MNQIKCLTVIFGAGVFISGLVGCGADKTKSHHNQKGGEAWSIGEQFFVRRGLNQMALQSAENQMESYLLTDEIHFNPSQKVRLKITTECFRDRAKIERHIFEEKIREKYSVYELLPKAVLLNPPDTRDIVSCSFEFLAANANGDTHKFRLRSSPIIMNTVDNLIQIEKSNKPLKSENNQMFQVWRSELWAYSLPSLASDQQAYHLECLNQTGQNSTAVGLVRLDQFKISPRQDGQNSLPDRPVDLCRIFLVTRGSRVEAFSDIFILREDSLKPIVERHTAISSIQPFLIDMSIGVGLFSIANPTSRRMFLSVGRPSALMRLKLIVLKRPGLISTLLDSPISYHFSGLEAVSLHDQTRYILPPFSSTLVTVTVPLAGLECQGKIVHGAYYFPLNERGLQINILEEFPGEHVVHAGSEIALETFFERYAYTVHGPAQLTQASASRDNFCRIK